MPSPDLRTAFIALMLAGSAGQTWAQIYSCVDKNGRRITSDRPIVECLDREQEQRGATGTVRKVIPPSYTAEERERVEAKRRAEEEARARVAEEWRRERALLVRYPNQAVHDKERQEALSQVDDVIAAVEKRGDTLRAQRQEIDTEMEFYQRDPSKAPGWLKRKLEDNKAEQQAQKRHLHEQQQEKQRINARFDEELARLRPLWAGQSGSRPGQ
ncbi:DUF4124 domain-containing protein [Hydrogenophaga sp.]|uniref:DUF4124 domain-containing protein n=1 Tax=Hydrogenophaga sp. TaxID=1904254 RepID=UPI0035B322BD